LETVRFFLDEFFVDFGHREFVLFMFATTLCFILGSFNNLGSELKRFFQINQGKQRVSQ